MTNLIVQGGFLSVPPLKVLSIGLHSESHRKRARTSFVMFRSGTVKAAQLLRKLPYTRIPGKSSLNVRSICPVCTVCPGLPVCPDDHIEHDYNQQ